jgi:tRNA-specific 2-thiouridylase
MTSASISPFEEHLAAPRGRGELRGSPYTGAAGGAACGDLVRIGIELDADVVTGAGFDASGCGAASAAASAAVALVRGRAALDAARLDAAAVSAELGGLSPGKLHAAVLASDALHRALGAAARAGAVRLEPSDRRVLVAVSGGVDSAVAALLAREDGREVVAVTLELWADADGDGGASCCSPEAVAGARALAQGMGLAHLTLDLRDSFRDRVVADYLGEHAAGRTPNPCVRCNAGVRFDALLELADRLGATQLATGHYARVAEDGRGPLLRSAVDPRKDQTYMLSGLAPEQLRRLWFPLGELTKPEVRALARDAGLPVADRRESQDLCFLAGTRRERFLTRHGGIEPRRGEIVSLSGEVLGAHEGQERFTVGQRRGLGVGGGEPLYVIAKDPGSNRVVVGPRRALATRTVWLGTTRLTRDAAGVDRVKLRYRQPPVRCSVAGDLPAGEHERLTVALDEEVDGVAPGQTACLMSGDAVVGWGVIDGAGRAPDPI